MISLTNPKYFKNCTTFLFCRHFSHEDKDGAKLFSVPDFIGDACKAIASRIRGAVASVKFDDFHKNSAKIIRASVFGLDEKNKVFNLTTIFLQ